MVERKDKTPENLSDLPNFKEKFTEPLEEIGIASVTDLQEALKDDSKTSSILDISGVGPKTVESWRNTVNESSTIDSVSAMDEEEIFEENEAPKQTERETLGNNMDESVVEEPRSAKRGSMKKGTVKSEAKIEKSEGITEQSVQPRNLYCSIDDMNKVKKTLTTLLQWDGAKKKGLARSVKYAVSILENAGLTVSVIEDAGPQIIVASKGNGGVVLWSHLDTDQEGNMDRSLQGVVALDFVYGRGAANVKGAVAVLLCVVKRMVTWDVPFTIVLTTDSLGEEKGAQWMAQSPVIKESKGVLMLAPTSMNPMVGQLGNVHMKVDISGEDAILATSDFLTKLSNGADSLPGQQWLRIGLIRGGKRKNPFGRAASCQTALEVLTSNPTDMIIGLVEDAFAGHDHLTEIFSRTEPLKFDPDSALVRSVIDIVGKESKLYGSSTEIGWLLPSVSNICICGPGNSGTGSLDNEFVFLGDLEKTYEMILKLVDRSNNIPPL